MRVGDTLIVNAIDRISRRAVDGLRCIRDVTDAGVHLVVLSQRDFDTTTPTDQLLLHLTLAIAEWEWSIIRARCFQGQQRARAEGKRIGSPPVLTAEARQEVECKLREGQPVNRIAQVHRVHHSVVIFHSPPPTSEGDWNYGFLLRNAKGNVYRWLYIDSKWEWARKLRLGEDQARLPFGNSRISSLDQTPGGKNKLRLVIIGDRAWTFINGKFQDSSDLSATQVVDPITLVVNDLREGETRFESFTVWKWHPGLQEIPEP